MKKLYVKPAGQDELVATDEHGLCILSTIPDHPDTVQWLTHVRGQIPSAEFNWKEVE